MRILIYFLSIKNTFFLIGMFHMLILEQVKKATKLIACKTINSKIVLEKD